MEAWSELLQTGARFFGLSSYAFERVLWTLVIWFVHYLVRMLVSSLLGRRIADVTKSYIYAKTARYIVTFTALLLTFLIWFGNVSGVAAYLGIVSAGLAIALQDPLTNLAGWIFISIRRPFAVGDRIQIGDHAGDVIDLRLFEFTIVEIGNWVDADQSTGRIIHVPNGWVFKQSLANYAQGFNFIWNEIPITVTFESSWHKAKRILADIASHHSPVKSQEAEREIRKAARKYMIYFNRLSPIVWTSVAENGVTLTIRYVCEPRKRRVSESAIWEEVLEAFAAHGDIDFAYPTTRFFSNLTEGKPETRPEEAYRDAPV